MKLKIGTLIVLFLLLSYTPPNRGGPRKGTGGSSTRYVPVEIYQ